MEVRQRRLDEIRLIKEDIPNPWTRYVGRSDSFLATDDDEIWQIMRITREGNIWTTTYANKGSFTAVWSNRTSYFPALTTSYAAYQQDMGADFTSDPIVMAGGGVSLTYTWDGNDANDGTIEIETSTDGVCWCSYPNGSFNVPLVAGCKQFDLPSTSVAFIRANYTANSNTDGELTISYNVAGVNKPWAVK